MKVWLSLDKMITAKIIKLVYIIGLFGIVLPTIGGLFDTSMVRFPINIFVSLFFGFISLLLWRVFCEGLILLFNIHDVLNQIRSDLANKKIQSN